MMQRFIILILVFLISCDEPKQEHLILIDNLNCSPTSNKYVNFKTENEEVCWNEDSSTRIDWTGTGNCGIVYQNIDNPFMATGVRGYVCNPSSDNCQIVERSIIFYFTASCNSYSTQDKFYSLMKIGDYALAQSTTDFNKFYIEYYENEIWYTSIGGNQKDSRIEVEEINEIAPNYITLTDGSKSGFPASLEVRLKASFNLYKMKDGQFFKRVTGAEIKGYYYRQTPDGQEWSDQYGK